MREGIYIDGPVEDGCSYTGFVVHFYGGDYKVSPFTHCTMPFILERAKARRVDGPVYVTSAPLFFINKGGGASDDEIDAEIDDYRMNSTMVGRQIAAKEVGE